MRLIALFVLLITFTACKTYSDDQLNDFDLQIREYVGKNKIQCEQSESGLYYKILSEGTGERVHAKDKISFSYEGRFLNDSIFDKQSEPVSFYVTDLIAAWKEIVLKLNEGGEAFLISPPQLGYGSRNLDDIPANSILVYTLKVHQVE